MAAELGRRLRGDDPLLPRRRPLGQRRRPADRRKAEVPDRRPARPGHCRAPSPAAGRPTAPAPVPEPPPVPASAATDAPEETPTSPEGASGAPVEPKATDEGPSTDVVEIDLAERHPGAVRIGRRAPSGAAARQPTGPSGCPASDVGRPGPAGLRAPLRVSPPDQPRRRRARRCSHGCHFPARRRRVRSLKSRSTDWPQLVPHN